MSTNQSKIPLLPDSIEDYIRDLSTTKCPSKFELKTEQLKQKVCIPIVGQQSKQTMYCCKDIDICFANPNIKRILLQFPDIHTFVMKVVLNSSKANFCEIWVISKKHGRIDLKFKNEEMNDQKRKYIHGCIGKLVNLFKESSITKKLEIHYPDTEFFKSRVEENGTEYLEYEVSANHFLNTEFKLSLAQMKYKNTFLVEYIPFDSE